MCIMGWQKFLLMFLNLMIVKPNGFNVAKTTSESALHNVLFGVKKSMRPFPTCEGEQLNVKLGLSLIQVVDVEETNEAIVINVWTRQTWYNSKYQWNRTQFGDIKSINIDPTKVWVPDIYTFSNVEDDKSYNGFLDTMKTKVILFSDGKHVWNAPVILRIGCAIDVKDFPFDTQHCEIRFGSFAYDSRKLNLTPESRKADLMKYSEHVQWKLLSITSTSDIMTDELQHLTYTNVVYHLNIKRKPLFLLVNLMFPNVLLSFISVAVYLVPVTAGERASFVVSLLLAMALFLTSAFNLLPDSSEAIPFFSYFLGMCLITMFLLTICLCYTLSIYYADAHVMELPDWMRHYVLEVLTPYLGINTKIKEKKWLISSRKLKLSIMRTLIKNNKIPKQHPGSLWSTYEDMYYKEYYNKDDEDITQIFKTGRMLSELSKGLSVMISHMEDADDIQKRQHEWHIVTQTLDTLFFYIFSFIFATIFMSCVFRVLMIYS